MKHNRRTVADLRALKGERQLTMLYVESPEEALEQAGAIGAEKEFAAFMERLERG